MLDVLGQLDTDVHLLSYLPGEKFEVTRKRVNSHLNATIFSVRKSAPKIFKAFALGRILFHGLGYARKADVILAHAPGVASGFPALILAKMFAKPLLIDHMDIIDPDTPRLIYNSVLRNSKIVFCISHYLEEEVKRLGGRGTVYLPVFISANIFQKDIAERAKIREKLGISERETVIGYAGSFSRLEGVSVLLKAFKNLSIKYGDIRLVVVGGRNVADSDDVSKLINELALNDKVILVPQQPYEMMPKYLSAFDIACSPKLDCEGNRAANPIKIYEYMSVGLPIVVSAVGEISNIIENGVDGFLVKPGDEGDLEKALEYAIQHTDLAQKVGARAREKIIRDYSQQAVLKTIKDTLEQFVSKN